MEIKQANHLMMRPNIETRTISAPSPRKKSTVSALLVSHDEKNAIVRVNGKKDYSVLLSSICYR